MHSKCAGIYFGGTGVERLCTCTTNFFSTVMIINEYTMSLCAFVIHTKADRTFLDFEYYLKFPFFCYILLIVVVFFYKMFG